MWEDDATPDLDTTALDKSIPWALTDAVASEDLCRQLWATLVGEASYLHQRWMWVTNPDEPPKKQQFLDSAVQSFYDRQIVKYSGLRTALPSLRREAADYTSHWEDSKTQAIKHLRNKMRSEKKAAESHMSEREVHQKRSEEIRDYIFKLMKSHPWVRIRYMACTEVVTRAQHILLIANAMLLMLLITLMFYYSKGSTCCVEFKTFIGCEYATVDSECYEYTSCAALYDLRDKGELDAYRMVYNPVYHTKLREDIDPNEYECTAFPQDTMMGQLWALIITLGIQIPVSLFFRALFYVGGSPTLAQHWKPSKAGRSGEEAHGNARLAGLVYLLTAVLLTPWRLGQVLAHLIFIHAYLLNGIGATLKRIFAAARRTWASLSHSVWFLWQTSVLGRPKSLVFQELEMQLKLREDEDRERGMMASVFMEARHESDSLCVQAAFVILALLWAVIVWVLLTYSMLIRDMLGPDVENKVIANWIIALIVDNLLIHVAKSLLISALVQWTHKLKEAGGSSPKMVMLWYEGFIRKYLRTTFEDTDISTADPLLSEAVMFGMPLL
ncbi:hypothetical protein CYMTET_39730 [Cymbomonas tetramitiformis]|uniref:Uncharacterized protein n=1 Tax=Cymbomonas tetramitiformis TaxID=36881 RepID=A0AAE0CBR3_9CHLO|nr:hypothetical protein CYMTET_39730 [Cymbomonas tetramitiformis]